MCRDHGAELSDKMWVAALVQMLPGGIGGVVCQSKDAQSTYQGIRGKMHNLVANRVSLEDAGPNPTEAGAFAGRVRR